MVYSENENANSSDEKTTTNTSFMRKTETDFTKSLRNSKNNHSSIANSTRDHSL